MSLELGCASILGVIILAAIVLCIWVVPSRKVAPPKPSPVIVTKNDDQIILDTMVSNAITMTKPPLNVGYPTPVVRAPVYHSPARVERVNRPIDFDDTSLLLASELASMDKYDVVDIKKPDETQWCVQPAVPTYNVEAPAVCAPTEVVYCAPVVEETKHHSTPSYDYGSHNSCSGHSSSSSDSSSSSSSSSSYGD
jgi:hypothetical protein